VFCCCFCAKVFVTFFSLSCALVRASINGDEILSELARRYKVNTNLIVKWKKQLMDYSAKVFASVKRADSR